MVYLNPGYLAYFIKSQFYPGYPVLFKMLP